MSQDDMHVVNDHVDGGEVDGPESSVDASGITRPKSAYQYHNHEQCPIQKQALLAEGKNASMGIVVQTVASMWRALSAEDKAPYYEMAEADRARYNQECAARDAVVSAEQEERRKKNEITGYSETRMRKTTNVRSEHVAVKQAAPKRKREESDASKGDKIRRRKARVDELNAVDEQMKDIKASRMEQVEARLKYLLSQSDIFAHFGAGTTKKLQTLQADVEGTNSTASSSNSKGAAQEDEDDGGLNDDATKTAETSKPAAAVDVPTSKSRVRNRRNLSSNTLDEDERQLMGEEADEDDNVNNAKASSMQRKARGVQLAQQPSIIVGGVMRPYQLEGLNWVIRLIENGINGILADEMGLGKTLQSISVIAYLNQYQNIPGPHLIMVPKSTLSNWMNEFARWCPTIRTLRFHGSKEEREIIARDKLRPGRTHSERSWDVVITTYEVMNLEKHVLMKIGWRFLIVDEAHRLKNEASQFAQNIRMLETQHRLLLTGTPLQNNLHELWALLNFLLPDVFSSADQFDDWFNLETDDQEAKQRIIGQLHKLLRPFMLRRLKVDVEKTLPPKTETILFIGMSDVQKQVYKQVLMRDIDVINQGAREKNDNAGRTAILNIVMQLRKCCNHPYLFPNVEDRTKNPLGDHIYKSCGKMVLLHKLLEKLFVRKNRVLVFSQMTRMLDILEDYMLSQGFYYCRIDGNTTYDEREDRIADFNRPGSDKFIFLLSTRAGGLGINLQTADTVILYDSDWNPQADLQAQDRAHRIGQKKSVQVFRLVTEDTIEVKVVERAQQKLKLDAMVVQQGRLVENQKKMSKTDLIDTLRFGADKIFRSTDNNITDADIDLILEEGRRKTEEMNSKLSVAEKGDMYDFRLDGTMHSQEFEGVNYSDEGARAALQAAEREADLSNFTMAALLEPSTKRERKTLVNYSESMAQALLDGGEGGPSMPRRPKAPRQLRLPRMEDWHFFNKERIIEIFMEEKRTFDNHVDMGDVPAPVNGRLQLLHPDTEAEKRQLLSQAFGDWTRVQFNSFIRGSARYGRHEYDKIAKEVVRPVDDIRRYARVFWALGKDVFGQTEWDKHMKIIEKGESRLLEQNKLTSDTASLIRSFDNAWDEMPFIKDVAIIATRSFTPDEDRFLLCLTHMYGYGAWDLIRTAVRRCEKFRFDFFLQSCSEEILARRCEALMKAAQRELTELESKKAAAAEEAGSFQAGADAVDISTWTPLNIDRLVNLTLEARLGARQFALTRARVNKIANEAALTQAQHNDGVAVETAAQLAARLAPTTSSGGPAAVWKMSTGKSTGRPVAKVLPDNISSVLAKLLVSSGAMGISSVVSQFIAKHPTISKRQVEMKIAEVAIKEKHEGDNTKVWHIRPAHVYLLTQEFKEEEEAVAAVPEPKPELKPPTAPRSPFQIFCVERFAEAKNRAQTVDEMRAMLVKTWDMLGSAGQNRYSSAAHTEHRAYNEALKQYEAQEGIIAGGTASASEVNASATVSTTAVATASGEVTIVAENAAQTPALIPPSEGAPTPTLTSTPTPADAAPEASSGSMVVA